MCVALIGGAQEEIAEARRKRHLNVLFLGMTRVAEYDARGGLAKGMKRFDLVEKMLREDVNEANMNPLRWVGGWVGWYHAGGP